MTHQLADTQHPLVEREPKAAPALDKRKRASSSQSSCWWALGSGRCRSSPGPLHRLLGHRFWAFFPFAARRIRGNCDRRGHGRRLRVHACEGPLPGTGRARNGREPSHHPPATVIGYYLLEVLSPGTQVGGFLTRVTGHVFVYNVWGCIIAAAVAAYPFCLRAARSAIAGVDPALEQAARTMACPTGESPYRSHFACSTRDRRGLTIGCARALGEYGATLMIGGDINGRTRTMSLAILDSFTTPSGTRCC